MSPFCGIPLLLIIGILAAAKPEMMWFLSEGWKFKNVEPSDLALMMTRLGGIVMLIAGICLLVLTFRESL